MTSPFPRLAPVLVPAIALAACQPSPEAVTDPVPVPPSSLALQPITLEETRGKLPEELGCAFAADGGARSPALLIGKGFVGASEPPKAAVKLDGRVRVLTGERGGGYGTLTAGTSFADGEGLRATLARGSDEGAEDGFESQAWIADLTVRDGDRTRTYAKGRWTCGP